LQKQILVGELGAVSAPSDIFALWRYRK